MKNRRAHIRYDFRNEISYSQNSRVPSEILKALTVDISNDGLGIYAFAPLLAGQQVMITDRLAGKQRKCTVAWCKELGDDVFRAGLSFGAAD